MSIAPNMSGTAFVATRFIGCLRPAGARETVRGEGKKTLAATTDGMAWRIDGNLTFPEEAVLLMIGNSDELVEACAQAIGAGIKGIVSQGGTFGIFYVRVKVSPIQTDTLVAIGSAALFWSRTPGDPSAPWRELDVGRRASSISLTDLTTLLQARHAEKAFA